MTSPELSDTRSFRMVLSSANGLGTARGTVTVSPGESHNAVRTKVLDHLRQTTGQPDLYAIDFTLYPTSH